jgi:hypothetical protein
MSGRRSLVWLGLTPEPERELPSAVAALRPPAPDSSPVAATARERRRVEQLILRGTQRSWLGYLAEVTALVVDAARAFGRGNPAAALVAGEVVLDHHRMLIGLPGAGYDRAAPQRHALEEALRQLKDRATPLEDHPTPLEDGPTPLGNHPTPLEDHPTPLDDGPTPLEDHPTPLDDGPTPLEDHPTPLDDGPTKGGAG